ncbi:MAG: TlpA family protein disulfide reductase [Bacteroidetes bacterium]|nr:TlpA family protein disulfide reductase [Bacteroidota bacterium]
MKMNRNTIFLILAFSIGSFILIFISSRFTNSKIEAEEKERKEKKAFQEIIDSTKNEHPFINEHLKGKTIVINVWATWCGPCRKEIPELNKLVKDFKSDTIVFIALDAFDSIEEISEMKKQKIEFDYQLLFDQKHIIKLINSFAISSEQGGIPINLILNSVGKIEHYHVGNNPKELQKMRDYLSSVKRIDNTL